MNAYFYLDNGNQHGPVSYDYLKNAGISKETLVWKDGLDDWRKAGEVPELNDLFLQPHPKDEPTMSEATTPAEGTKSLIKMNSFPDNTKMFRNSLLFKGRAGRLEFLLAVGIFILGFLLFGLFASHPTYSEVRDVFAGIILFIDFYFILSECTRRLHDMGHSGLLMFLCLLAPISPFLFIWMLVGKGDEDSNEYGSSTKTKYTTEHN